jgi:hypothetical protein
MHAFCYLVPLAGRAHCVDLNFNLHKSDGEAATCKEQVVDGERLDGSTLRPAGPAAARGPTRRRAAAAHRWQQLSAEPGSPADED